jgi:hypothetical protein
MYGLPTRGRLGVVVVVALVFDNAYAYYSIAQFKLRSILIFLLNFKYVCIEKRIFLQKLCLRLLANAYEMLGHTRVCRDRHDDDQLEPSNQTGSRRSSLAGYISLHDARVRGTTHCYI